MPAPTGEGAKRNFKPAGAIQADGHPTSSSKEPVIDVGGGGFPNAFLNIVMKADGDS